MAYILNRPLISACHVVIKPLCCAVSARPLFDRCRRGGANRQLAALVPLPPLLARLVLFTTSAAWISSRRGERSGNEPGVTPAGS
jgi:hypothetical protein